MKKSNIILVGERDPEKIAHQGIEASLELYRRDHDLDYTWVSTADINAGALPDIFSRATGVWCTPGSPYASTAGALMAIQHARIAKMAFLGTCGGFQHALMEYATNVLRRAAEHEELTPAVKDALIVKLSCSLVGAKGRVRVSKPELFADVHGAAESFEEFNCNYGLSANMAEIFRGSDLEFVAHDEIGQPRAIRLRSHPFFVGTLFQPERRALTGALHPMVRAFFDAAGK